MEWVLFSYVQQLSQQKAAYNFPWTRVSKKSRQLLTIIMCRSNNPLVISGFYMYKLCYKSFIAVRNLAAWIIYCFQMGFKYIFFTPIILLRIHRRDDYNLFINITYILQMNYKLSMYSLRSWFLSTKTYRN